MVGLSASALAQTADFTFTPFGPTVGSPVSFFPAGAPAECDWNFGDPSIPPVQDPTCSSQAPTYANAGIYTVTLTVLPSGSTKTKDVGVLPPGNTDNSLTPEFTPSTFNPIVGQPVTFTDSTSPANSVGHWTWAFGDGSSSFLHDPSHTFNTIGPITVALTVANNQTGGGGAFVTHVLNVGLPPTNTPTPSQTQAPTQTPTITPTPTETPFGQPTSTATVSPTQTATPPPPGTGTPTATPPGPTATVTPTVNTTGTLTPTIGINPTSTRTRTPTRTPVPGPETLAGFVPVVGSTPGNFGSFFKTALQLLNPGTSSSSGRLVYHPMGVSGASNDPSISWTLAPGQTIAYDDVVTSIGRTGLGSLDVLVAKGSPIPIVLARVYNDSGAGGTSGFAEPFYRTAEIPAGGSGFLIGPSDISRFRYNVGFRTLGDPVKITATVRNAAGGVLHTVTNTYPKNFFLQTSATGFLGFSLGNNQSIQISFANGGLIAYGATIDNVTNDPSAQFLSYAATQIADGAPRRPGSRLTPLLFAAILATLGIGVGAVVAKR